MISFCEALNMETSLKLKLCFTSAVIAVSCASVVYAFLRRKRRMRRYEDASEALSYMNIMIVTNEEICNTVVDQIRRRSIVQQAIGFDCEWVTVNGKRQAVALLQLSTLDGYCGLFRLNLMKTIPNSLKLLLEDPSIYKVGVAPIDDAKYLYQDYSVGLKSSLDVRHVARARGAGADAGGLAALSQALLHIILDKNWRVRCSDWEAEQLTDKQVAYAAADAHVAIKIYSILLNEYNGKRNVFNWFHKNRNDIDVCSQYSDVPFKVKHNKQQGGDDVRTGRQKEKNARKGGAEPGRRYPHAARASPLYHNCFLQAPDGELLCTCDNKKARWYVEKGLARVVGEAPLTVRLRFEPAGRSVGAVGRYYQLAKENKCVVCGSTDSYIRKNVVPREYRKYFPEVMKDHSSHDVVLLCVRCHQRSNARDLRVRAALAATCAAPLAPRRAPSEHDALAKKIRSAARALLYQSQKHALPEERRRQLERAVLQHLGLAQLSPALLRRAAALPAESTPNTEESHGMKVVEYFLEHDGLLRLEELWREHFLQSMEPQYMPELWSTKHNEERLQVKFDEGRLSEKEVQSIGQTHWSSSRAELEK